MNHTSLLILSPTTVWHRIQHLSCYGSWLILSVLLGHFHKVESLSEMGRKAVGQQGTTDTYFSFQEIRVLPSAAPCQLTSIHGAGAQESNVTWHGLATTEVTSTWGSF